MGSCIRPNAFLIPFSKMDKIFSRDPKRSSLAKVITRLVENSIRLDRSPAISALIFLVPAEEFKPLSEPLLCEAFPPVSLDESAHSCFFLSMSS